MMTKDPLPGRVALVTGAAGGIGGTMARALLRAGLRVVAIDVTAAGLDRLRTQSSDDNLLLIPCDVSDEAACGDAVDRAVEGFGALHILVNCAGLTGEMPAAGPFPRFWERDPATWRRVQAVNSTGAFNMAYHAVRPMLRQRFGRIVNISTSFSTMVMPGMAAYGPSKAAMEASAAIWAAELANTGVTVNVLLPGGAVDTPFAPAGMPKDLLLDPGVMVAPLLWLVSDGSGSLTGMRFIARDWDASLPAAEAAAAIAAPAGWAPGAA